VHVERHLVLERLVGDEGEVELFGQCAHLAVVLGDVVGTDVEPTTFELDRATHAARTFDALEHGDRVALRGEQTGHGQPARAGTDDADAKRDRRRRHVAAPGVVALGANAPCRPNGMR